MIARLRWILSKTRVYGLRQAWEYLFNFYKVHGFFATYCKIVLGKDELVSRSYYDKFFKWYDKNSVETNHTVKYEPFTVPNIVIIGTLDLPQCKKYRVLQKTEQLAMLGFQCCISNFYDVPRTINSMQMATAVLFYRLPYNAISEQYIREARRLSLPIGYDVDDPIFDREIYADNKNLNYLKTDEKKKLLTSSTQYLNLMKKCDFFIASTPKMKETIKKYVNAPIFLWRNVIDGETYSQVKYIYRNHKPQKNNDELSISYLSGSRAHEADFQQVVKPITQLMEEFPNINLLIAGYAQIPEEFNEFKDRIIFKPFSDYRGYLNFLSLSDINIVPLLTDVFNDCKSAIRYLEASALGVPTVATNIGDFKNLVVDGQNGYTAEYERQWYEKIKCLIESKEHRMKIGKAAREYVLDRQTNKNIINEFDSQLKLLLMGKQCSSAC